VRNKLTNSNRLTREEIRDSVDTYLDSMDIKAGGGMDGELMQAIMMSAISGGGFAGTPEQQDATEEQQKQVNSLLGSGGINGQSENDGAR